MTEQQKASCICFIDHLGEPDSWKQASSQQVKQRLSSLRVRIEAPLVPGSHFHVSENRGSERRNDLLTVVQVTGN